MYSLNLSEDNRILSACVCLDSFEYVNKVDALPDGDITNYKYINSEYVYDPLPKPEPPAPEPTIEERVEQTEADIEFIAMMTGIDMEG
ncbi:MAG: hypothetical protein ACI4S2_12330 [Lachnospiraceae bacterium]